MPTSLSRLRFTSSSHCAFRSAVVFGLFLASGHSAPAESLTGVTKVKFTASVPSVMGKILTLENVRVKSNTTNTGDYVSAEFKFDSGAFQFNLQNATVYRGVGIFALDTNGNAFFAKDAPEAVTLVGPAGQRYAANQYFQLSTVGETYTMDLTLGQVVSFIFGETNDVFTFEFRDPAGRLLGGVNGGPAIINVNSGGAANSESLAILQTGRYTLRLVPKTKPSLAVTVGFLQGNRRPLATLSDGGTFNGNLTNGLVDYAKYSVALNQGDVLTIGSRASRNIGVALVYQNSQIVYQSSGVGGGNFVYQAIAAGTYYLFVYNDNAFNNGSFSGSVRITR